jgi:hypothetical protein
MEGERIARRAHRQSATPYTALRHHVTGDNLQACFAARDGTKAPGVDGVTKARYVQPPEDHLKGLHERPHQMSFPHENDLSSKLDVRRYPHLPHQLRWMAKADGTIRSRS